MTIVRTGSNEKFAAGWEAAFGSKKKKTTRKKAATAKRKRAASKKSRSK